MWDVIVLGGGAAGLYAGIEAARRGRRVLVIEGNRHPGEKIRISGGGRCNFTNLGISRATISERFLSENPRFALSALSRHPARAFLDRLEAAGIEWTEKALGQLFCAGSAREVVDWLVSDLRGAGAELRPSTTVGDVTRAEGGFAVATSGGTERAAKVIVALGGKPIPKMGATDRGLRIARAFGLPVVDTRAALVPLTFEGGLREEMAALAGASVEGAVRADGPAFADGLLFTHRGLSGPSVLQASSYWREGAPVEVDLAHGTDLADALAAQRQAGGRMGVATALARHMPERLAKAVIARAGIAGNLADQSNAKLSALERAARAWTVQPSGSEGYRTAEVMRGGVATDALDPRTLEARSVPGLHFVGEVVDVTGWLGGYNFQWAWASGWAAGQAV
ncbi:aminoacetone oxidase family FAD-binding enzyme [Jannaschia sp. Os4]|uniref:NAD(P)/FAD-dependent oxidoreductase n=1 Tax=Jannaschia sp. Os4 TaxID=2807617 RepID=UPI00193A41B3|nr:aminoacetone oxidase family FAD-binding enzyme [Jannaschia sp. Os4]MBM2577921.1 aminoacetone oxidase family FAD-binding enzyme [Jannaschia sp. Os4]